MMGNYWPVVYPEAVPQDAHAAPQPAAGRDLIEQVLARMRAHGARATGQPVTPPLETAALTGYVGRTVWIDQGRCLLPHRSLPWDCGRVAGTSSF